MMDHTCHFVKVKVLRRFCVIYGMADQIFGSQILSASFKESVAVIFQSGNVTFVTWKSCSIVGTSDYNNVNWMT